MPRTTQAVRNCRARASRVSRNGASTLPISAMTGWLVPCSLSRSCHESSPSASSSGTASFARSFTPSAPTGRVPPSAAGYVTNANAAARSGDSIAMSCAMACEPSSGSVQFVEQQAELARQALLGEEAVNPRAGLLARGIPTRAMRGGDHGVFDRLTPRGVRQAALEHALEGGRGRTSCDEGRGDQAARQQSRPARRDADAGAVQRAHHRGDVAWSPAAGTR